MPLGGADLERVNQRLLMFSQEKLLDKAEDDMATDHLNPYSQDDFHSDMEALAGRSRFQRSKFSVLSCRRLRRSIVASATLCLTILLLFWLLPSAYTHDEFDIVFKNGPASTFSASRFENRQYSFLHNVLPVPCHSHNDYWRRTPLYAALGSGCISVEADVWLFDDDLFVGHSIKSLNSVSTLRSMYLDPLHRILEAANTESVIGGVATDGRQGVFAAYPTQTLVLLVDFKTNGPETYLKLHEQLQRLRDAGWLTHWNGTDRVERPITVVVSGDAPFDMIANANITYRDIFYDAPLTFLEADGDPTTISALSKTSAQTLSPSIQDMLRYKYNPSNSWYASSNVKTIEHGIVSWFAVTPDQIEDLGQHIQQAEIRGLRSRYWGTPRWPRSLRDQIWQVLLQQGASVLNVDDLRAARKGSWGRWR